MRNKLLIFALVAAAGITIFAIAAGVTVFALANDAPVQTEQVSLEQPVEVAPIEVEPVKVVNPVIKHDQAKYNGYAGYEGDCPYSHSKAQLVEAPTQEDQVTSDQFLTLAE